MKLDFEKFLNENGLKVGDKVRLSNGDICEIYQGENSPIDLKILGCEGCYDLSTLGIFDFEKVELKKKVGDLICEKMDCDKCPLRCVTCCGLASQLTLREKTEKTLKTFPELELMREYFEKELDKEVE